MKFYKTLFGKKWHAWPPEQQTKCGLWMPCFDRDTLTAMLPADVKLCKRCFPPEHRKGEE